MLAMAIRSPRVKALASQWFTRGDRRRRPRARPFWKTPRSWALNGLNCGRGTSMNDGKQPECFELRLEAEEIRQLAAGNTLWKLGPRGLILEIRAEKNPHERREHDQQRAA